MKNIVALMFLFLINSSSFADDWKYLTTTNSSEIYMNADSLRRTGNEARIWMKYVPLDKSLRLESIWKLHEFSCGQDKNRDVNIIAYFNDGHNQTFPPTDWQYNIPNTLPEALYKAICK